MEFIYETLKHKYPTLEVEVDYILKDNNDGEGAKIAEWKTEAFPKPNSAELANYWNEFKDQILDLFKPAPNQIDVLEQTQADLIMTLMMGGVI
jgi:XkdW protein